MALSSLRTQEGVASLSMMRPGRDSCASKEARICDIRSIDVHESGLKGLLGLGTLEVSSAGTAGVEVRFRDMRRAHDLKQLIRQLQRGDLVAEG